MNATNPITDNDCKPLVSIILPAYNEAALLDRNVIEVYNYINTLNHQYDWEIIIVNDGSADDTGKIADALCKKIPILHVYHHCVNLNLGNALITGFKNSRGDYIITLDIDLSYSVDHIEKLLNTITTTKADMVLASPYMKGGKTTAVPYLREIMSRWVNWLMSLSSQEKYSTFTCMVRAYKGNFIRSLNLKTKDYEIFPEIIYKAMILRARIIEIPAHLDWSYQLELGKKRVSGMRVMKGVFHGLMAAFIFRPYVYFLSAGLLVMFTFLFVLAQIMLNVYRQYVILVNSGQHIDEKVTNAISIAFQTRPHAFLIGGFLFIIGLQLLIQGFSSLQSKRYYEEIFHINTTLLKKINKFSKETLQS
jgi:glycosyltransferase involved in cell wall biosynthesis